MGHLPIGRDGKFAKPIFYLLRADSFGLCEAEVTSKAVSLSGDWDGMKVP